MESKFTGRILGFIGIKLGSSLIISFTLGLGVPWAVVLKQRWITKHQIIDGQRLIFDGTGSQLFGQYIKWFLLSIITVGIYGLWVPIKIQSWVTSHTHVEVIQNRTVQEKVYENVKVSAPQKSNKFRIGALTIVTAIITTASFLLTLLSVELKYFQSYHLWFFIVNIILTFLFVALFVWYVFIHRSRVLLIFSSLLGAIKLLFLDHEFWAIMGSESYLEAKVEMNLINWGWVFIVGIILVFYVITIVSCHVNDEIEPIII